MDLRRRTYMEERPKADEEYLTAAQLRQRISQPVPYLSLIHIYGTGNAATVTVPPAGGTIVPNADGSVTLPGGSTVQTGDQTVTIPDGGGTIQPDGEIRYTVCLLYTSCTRRCKSR